jgi:PhnB protein
MSTKFIPDGYHSITPCFIAEGAQKLVDFLKQAFNAKETFCMRGPGETIAHAELLIGDSIVMVSDASPQWQATKGAVYLYVKDVDAVYRQAIEAGAISVREPANQFYGDRSAGVIDPLGNHWGVATRIEEVPPEELTRRAAAFAKQCAET